MLPKNNWEDWEAKYVPWANHKFNLPDLNHMWSSLDELDEVRDWAAKSLKGRYELSLGHGYFEFGEDSVLFALRWL